MAEKGQLTISLFPFQNSLFPKFHSKVDYNKVAGDSLPTCITNFGVSRFVKLASTLTLRLRNTEC